MKVVAANLRPLPGKFYSTEIGLVVNLDGHNYNLYIEISGYAPVASTREIARGWDPEDGMDHTESEAHYRIAKAICACLKEAQLDGVDL
jgi:hypothetical protein